MLGETRSARLNATGKVSTPLHVSPAAHPLKPIPSIYLLTSVSSPCFQDSDYDANPTCGWYMLGSYRVPDSQGFTCECSFSQIWDYTLGSGSQRRT